MKKTTLHKDDFNKKVGLGRLCGFNCGGDDGHADWCALTEQSPADCEACKIVRVDFWEADFRGMSHKNEEGYWVMDEIEA